MSSADIIWKRGDRSMQVLGTTIGCRCDVRTLANGRRALNEVVYTTTRSRKQGVPYDPQLFPVGLWRLIAVEVPDLPDDYLGPKFIRTDACQKVERWDVEQADQLRYLQPTNDFVWDYGYLIHWSSWPTSLGCLCPTSVNDQLWICACASMALREGREMLLEVVS